MTERWERHAVEGECEYCGEKRPVMPDPFGQQPACQPCWELIAYGEGE